VKFHLRERGDQDSELKPVIEGHSHPVERESKGVVKMVKK
jgi:hypothetical protein